MKNAEGDNTRQASGEGQPDNKGAPAEPEQLDDDLQIEIERNESGEQDLKSLQL